MEIEKTKTQSDVQKWMVLIAIGTGTFMAALDGSIVNISLPVISQTFNVDVAQIEWVVTVYLLVVSGLLLSFGRLGDLRGHKQIYLIGFFVFVLSSIFCGLASSIPMLIAFRAVQALGAAMISSNSPAILTKSFPVSQRGQALGLQATMTYLGLTVGPSLGGFLTQHFSWRSVFYANIPVGLAAIWLSYRYIRTDNESHTTEPFDIRGALLFMAGLTSLLLGLNQGHVLGWTSPIILGLLITAGIFLAIFIALELKIPSPMLDLKLFQHPVFSLSTISAILNYICIYAIIFLMPFYLINGRELSSSQAGLLLTAQPVVMAVVAPISGTLSDKFGARIPGMIGMGFLSLGMFMLSRLGTGTPLLVIILSLALVGFGTGTFISPNNSALMGSAPRQRQGIAAGILATARNFGMVLGVGLAGAIFNTILYNHINPGSTEALFSAFQTTFLVASGIAFIGVFTTGVREA